MKIKFFLSDNEMAPTTISGKLFAQAIKNEGYDVEVIQNTVDKKDILAKPNCDAIFFQKTIYSAHSYEDIKHLKGKVYLIHIDDDFVGMNQIEHINTLNVTDLILVANKKHAELLKNYVVTATEAVESIPDFQNYPYIPFEERKNNPLIICWQKNFADAYVDDLLMIKDVLIKAHEKYNVELHLYGWHLGKHYGWTDRSSNIRDVLPFAEFIPFQPSEIYLKELVPQIAKSDICIVPYLNIPERDGKGAFGLKPMMMLGLPVVVSDFEVHKSLITDGVNGYLASTPEEWYQKLESLIVYPEIRREFSIAGRHMMESEYSYNSCTKVLIAALKKHIPIFN
ncbi:MAG: hypothetical protein CVU84_12155 [Firmicutes bacterium HGW-Firmicutes-1]|jgi:glycosyltransferase involved in cell wall biosynthesis|nr:MAG: hypothetical protein CVU84_12155 [Firmicutes bacterium HGW-Firmicutes-1]